MEAITEKRWHRIESFYIISIALSSFGVDRIPARRMTSMGMTTRALSSRFYCPLKFNRITYDLAQIGGPQAEPPPCARQMIFWYWVFYLIALTIYLR